MDPVALGRDPVYDWGATGTWGGWPVTDGANRASAAPPESTPGLRLAPPCDEIDRWRSRGSAGQGTRLANRSEAVEVGRAEAAASHQQESDHDCVDPHQSDRDAHSVDPSATSVRRTDRADQRELRLGRRRLILGRV